MILSRCYYKTSYKCPVYLRDGDGDDDIMQLQMFLLKFVLNVDVATALPVVRGPAVN